MPFGCAPCSLFHSQGRRWGLGQAGRIQPGLPHPTGERSAALVVLYRSPGGGLGRPFSGLLPGCHHSAVSALLDEAGWRLLAVHQRRCAPEEAQGSAVRGSLPHQPKHPCAGRLPRCSRTTPTLATAAGSTSPRRSCAPRAARGPLAATRWRWRVRCPCCWAGRSRRWWAACSRVQQAAAAAERRLQAGGGWLCQRASVRPAMRAGLRVARALARQPGESERDGTAASGGARGCCGLPAGACCCVAQMCAMRAALLL